MSAEFSLEEREIRSALDVAVGRLDEFSNELRAVDADLESMAEERQRVELVEEVCGSLETLNELGGLDLFWGGLREDGFDAHVGLVRERIVDFSRKITQIEERRSEILMRIGVEQDSAAILEDDLLEMQEQAELKKLEWVIERDVESFPYHETRMPWSRGGEDDARFRKSIAGALLLSLLLAILLPLVDLPIPDRWETVEIPERLTRLIKNRPVPLPPVVEPKLEPQKTQAETPEDPQELATDTKPKASPEPKVREKVASQGILALRDQFAGLATSDPASRLGAQARINRTGESAVGRQGRVLVSTQNPNASGGINVAALGRDSVGGGGQALEGVQVARATSSIGTASGNGRPLSDGPGLSRTDEEIQIVFDRHKAALYRLYNRELRRDPTLKGQIVLKIVIEPDGSVSLCEVRSSDMNAPNLSTKVVARVKTFDFGAKDGIPPVSILYPIDFLPAT